MSENILVDVLQAVALFFLNPLFIVALLIAVALGYFRVKRERRSFKVRLLPGLTELKRLLAESWPYALVLSIVISGAGLMVDPGWLVLFSVAALVGLVSFYYKMASPIYFAAAAFFALYFIGKYAGRSHLEAGVRDKWICLGNWRSRFQSLRGCCLLRRGCLSVVMLRSMHPRI